MTTLSEIERQAYLKKIRTWHEQRGMDIEHQILTEPVMRYIERLEARLDSIEKACKRDALFKKFLDQGFWHAHEVDLIWRYNGEDRRHEADWLKSIFYALQHKREEAR